MRSRGTDDRGTVLILMPAAVLIVIVLGAFAADATLVFLAERELANLSAGIANDIAGAAVDDPAFYTEGQLRLSPTRASDVAYLALSTYTPQYLETLQIEDLNITDDQVTITISATVNYIFSSALPTTPNQIPVSATSTATARQE